jgi:hypothetical protein
MQPTQNPERRPCGKAWDWSGVVEEFGYWTHSAPLLDVARVLAASPAAAQIFPTVSYDGLLITDGPLFYRDDRVLFVTYFPEQRQFRLQYRLAGQIHSERFASEADVLSALATTLHDCYGITLAPPTRNAQPPGRSDLRDEH